MSISRRQLGLIYSKVEKYVESCSERRTGTTAGEVSNLANSNVYRNYRLYYKIWLKKLAISAKIGYYRIQDSLGNGMRRPKSEVYHF